MNDTVITGAAIGFLVGGFLTVAIALTPPVVPLRGGFVMFFIGLVTGIGAAIGWLVS